MGNKQNTTSAATVLKEKDKREIVQSIKETTISALEKSHFEFLYVIGRGGFGKV